METLPYECKILRGNEVTASLIDNNSGYEGNYNHYERVRVNTSTLKTTIQYAALNAEEVLVVLAFIQTHLGGKRFIYDNVRVTVDTGSVREEVIDSLRTSITLSLTESHAI